jgi:prepilin-type N-terminal cleavage/methylation domain-containing protein
MPSHKQCGYSMLELMIVISILLILTAVTDISLQPALKQEHVTNAFNLTISAMRRARDQAASDMQIYVLTFGGPVAGVNGGSITMNQTTPAGPQMFSWTLPPEVAYRAEAGIPNSSVNPPTTPDGFGVAANAIDFDWGPYGAGNGNTIYFYPDGSARDANGNINNGVIYLDIPGQLPTCRAISLWGFTGRIRGWQLYQVAGVWTWVQQ